MYHVMKFQAPFERLKEYNSSPEIILYKAIITQAIIDAPRAKTLETDAKKWIFSNSDYFQKICYIAGIEPSFVVKITKEAIKLNHKKLEFNKKPPKTVSTSNKKQLIKKMAG